MNNILEQIKEYVADQVKEDVRSRQAWLMRTNKDNAQSFLDHLLDEQRVNYKETTGVYVDHALLHLGVKNSDWDRYHSDACALVAPTIYGGFKPIIDQLI